MTNAITLTDRDLARLSCAQVAAALADVRAWQAAQEAAGHVVEWSYSPELGRTVWRVVGAVPTVEEEAA